MKDLVIRILQDAVNKAATEYFKWSHGLTLYDAAEPLMTIFAAQALHETLGPDYQILLELPLSSIDGYGGGGRLDLAIKLHGKLLFAIEVKRYTAVGNAQSDIKRLLRIRDASPETVGLYVAPCFIDKKHPHWPIDACATETTHMGQRWHISDPVSLGSTYQNGQGRNWGCAVVVEAGTGALDPVTDAEHLSNLRRKFSEIVA